MIGINLIDERVLWERRRRRRLQRWALVLVCTLLLGAFPIAVELSREQQVRILIRERAEIGNRIERTRIEIAATGAEIRTLETQIARSDALQTKRSWAGLFAMLAGAMPDDMWLLSIATDPAVPDRGNVDLTADGDQNKRRGKTLKKDKSENQVVTLIAPRSLVFEGFSLEHRSLYEFMSQLKHTGSFSDVSLTKASEEPLLNGRVVRFDIRCRW